MSARLFDNDDMGAIFSPCRTWRYRLWRRWGAAPSALFIMLNPSTADEIKNDPTVARCQKYAERWGYGGVEVCNIFAYRATDPQEMKPAPDPVGPENRQHLLRAASDAGIIVCAWGSHGTYRNRAAEVLGLLYAYDLTCLALTKDGQPRHPLYLRGDLTPRPYP